MGSAPVRVYSDSDHNSVEIVPLTLYVLGYLWTWADNWHQTEQKCLLRELLLCEKRIKRTSKKEGDDEEGMTPLLSPFPAQLCEKIISA